MKYPLLIILFLTYSIQGNCQSKIDIKTTTKLVIDYTSNWNYKIKSRYSNNDLLEEIMIIRNNDEFKSYVLDSLNIKTNQLFYISDTIKIEGYNFSYKNNRKIAEKNLTKRVVGLKRKQKGKGNKISFSTPIFSLDKKIALIYVRTYCGPLCGSNELFILERVNNNWQIKERKLISIS